MTWLTLGIENAKNAAAHLQLNDNVSSNTHQSQDPGNVLRRLWACCLIRDRMMALSLRQSPLIAEGGLNPDPHFRFTPEDLANEVERSRVYNMEAKAGLADIFYKTVKLSRIVGDILEITYHTRCSSGWNKFHELKTDGLKQLENRLLEWYQDCQPSALAFNIPNITAKVGDAEQCRSLILFGNSLHVLY